MERSILAGGRNANVVRRLTMLLLTTTNDESSNLLLLYLLSLPARLHNSKTLLRNHVHCVGQNAILHQDAVRASVLQMQQTASISTRIIIIFMAHGRSHVNVEFGTTSTDETLMAHRLFLFQHRFIITLGRVYRRFRLNINLHECLSVMQETSRLSQSGS